MKTRTRVLVIALVGMLVGLLLPSRSVAQQFDGVYFVSSFVSSSRTVVIPGAFFSVQSGSSVVVSILGWDRADGSGDWLGIVGSIDPVTGRGSGFLAVPTFFNYRFRTDLTVSYTVTLDGCRGTFSTNLGESGAFARVFPAGC